MDWVTGKGTAGKGFHIYCHYEEGNEIELYEPIHYEGLSVYKHAWVQDCYRDVFVDIEWEGADNCNPKYGTCY